MPIKPDKSAMVLGWFIICLASAGAIYTGNYAALLILGAVLFISLIWRT